MATAQFRERDLLIVQLELHTMGGLSLRRNSVPLQGQVLQPRRIAMLAVLAAAGARGVSRDKLLALLWPEKPESEARHALSQWLFLLRRDLDVSDLVLGTTQLVINRERLQVDVTTFDEAVSDKDYETAARLYTGPFLDGFFLNDAIEFQHWLDGARASRQAQAITAIEHVARQAESRGDLAAAIVHWRRVVALDLFGGSAVRNLMSALTTAGDTAGALQIASKHAALLSAELNTAPSSQVAGLTARLKQGVLPSAQHADVHRAPDADESYTQFVREALRTRYLVRDVVQRTSTGTVFDAADVRSDASVLLRTLRSEIARRIDRGIMVGMLERASRVRHENIVPLTDVGVVEHLVFTASPPVGGELLRSRLAREHRLPVAQAVDIALSLAAALECAEKYQLPHLDLTPRRVQLVDGHALLTDLGIMYGIISSISHDSTESGVVLGTPAYMSPELLSGDPSSSSASDIYSLGCVLFHTLTGEPPHQADTARALTVRRLREPPPSARAVRSDVPKALDSLLCEVLATQVGERIGSARVLVEELRGIRAQVVHG